MLDPNGQQTRLGRPASWTYGVIISLSGSMRV